MMLDVNAQEWRPVVVQVGRGCFVLLLMAAAALDVRIRRIPNGLNLCLALLGLACAGVAGGTTGVLSAFAALGAGLAVGVVLFATGLGAGDAKLFAAGATWLGGIVASASALLTAALIGAPLAIVVLVRSRGARFAALRIAQLASRPRELVRPLPVSGVQDKVPYGVAIAGGLLAQALVQWRGQ